MPAIVTSPNLKSDLITQCHVGNQHWFDTSHASQGAFYALRHHCALHQWPRRHSIMPDYYHSFKPYRMNAWKLWVLALAQMKSWLQRILPSSLRLMSYSKNWRETYAKMQLEVTIRHWSGFPYWHEMTPFGDTGGLSKELRQRAVYKIFKNAQWMSKSRINCCWITQGCWVQWINWLLLFSPCSWRTFEALYLRLILSRTWVLES
jgi:hypothetical protein